MYAAGDRMVTELKYSATNTYLVRGKKGLLLFDTGWAGTFPQFCRALGEAGCSLQEIRYILISHYHPDHMGIAQEIASRGPVIAAADVQKDYIHQSDYIFQKEDNRFFMPVKDADLRIVPLSQSREFLEELGLNGEIIHTPGHSEDSISLLLDDGSLFVGDLNPLYELELHAGTKIEKSWKRLLEADPVTIYYGHAKTAHPRQEKKEGAGAEGNKKAVPENEQQAPSAGDSIKSCPCRGSIFPGWRQNAAPEVRIYKHTEACPALQKHGGRLLFT